MTLHYLLRQSAMEHPGPASEGGTSEPFSILCLSPHRLIHSEAEILSKAVYRH